ncbi:MAG: nitrogenase [Lachnospiraceae bacterium]|nr:nitrogenase [Lachnospiraceae bacterium]
MLRKIGEHEITENGAVVRMGDASFPVPFSGGLEYSSPARGTWNIVHTGMLIPEVHEIFVCAASCLRGVVLTAAEMNALDRFSTVEVKENNLLDGNLEELLIDGVSDIINKLEKRPPAVLVYTSCVHHFTGCDWGVMFGTLRERFPDIDIVDCYMNPTLRKSGLTPDQIMRRQLYALLKPRKINSNAVAIIGNDLPTKENSDLYKILKSSGLKIHEITSCKTYAEYQEMAESALYFTYYPAAKAGGDTLAKRLGGKHIYLPYSWDYDEIIHSLEHVKNEIIKNRTNDVLCNRLNSNNISENTITDNENGEKINNKEDNNSADKIKENTEKTKETTTAELYKNEIALCEKAFEKALAMIGDTPIAIDYTFCPRPISVAKMLLTHGFNVKRIYLDSFTGEEKADYEFLKDYYPDLELYATVNVKSRFMASCNSSMSRDSDDQIQNNTGELGENKDFRSKWLAIGQKAAYFLNTNYFVNIVEGGGMFGFEAIIDTLELMRDAFVNIKDMRSLVQIKGLGCGNCCNG